MDWQLTCRVCLETGDMVSFFDCDENNTQLCDKYCYCSGIEITKEDSLPTLICLNCVDRLTSAYQFKQQCLTSNETLKECLEEFIRTSAVVAANVNTHASNETETITIKQENGMLLQYDLPIEHDPQAQWTRSLSANKAVLTKSPGPKKRGRPRKYPNPQGEIVVSPYKRRKSKESDSTPLANLLISQSISVKEEPVDYVDDAFANDDPADPDFSPVEDDPKSDVEIKESKKRGRPRKQVEKSKKSAHDDNGVDVLLQETIMAYSEPIPEHILNPKPKVKKSYPKKKYVYDKIHICETCGQSFTSNASLQAHIRRHLGIKPFVCSVCEYSCVMKEALKRHMLKHTGERPYQCRICDRRFGDFGTRQKHERLHLGLRPYQCSLCGKSFTYSYVLANHMLTHTGEKKYSCGPCNKKFTKSHHLKYHNKVHHKELYALQQIESEAKMVKQEIKLVDLPDEIQEVIAEKNVKILEESMNVHEQTMEEQPDDDDDKETDRAVAGMQAVALDSEFDDPDDIKPPSFNKR